MKGIILAGGMGTRWYPVTKTISKQLLPVYDKPMIYYPLCTLMEAGISDILIISSPEFLPSYRDLLGDGSQWGIRLIYREQARPRGIAEAFLLGEDFIGHDHVCLILGDNLFHGASFRDAFRNAVPDPVNFGVLTLDANGTVTDITEKPEIPPSSYAVSGIYVYDHDVCSVAKTISPSARGELEITDINRFYLKKNKLTVSFENTVWMDMGTPESLFEAASYIRDLQNQSDNLLFCPEKTAFRNGWITKKQLLLLADHLKNTPYGQNLLKFGEQL